MPSLRTKAEGRHSNAPLLPDEKRAELIAALDGKKTCRELAEQFGLDVDYLHVRISKWRRQGIDVKAKREKMTITIRGVTYPDVEAAAAALKVKPMTIYAAVVKGTTETVGSGRGRPRNGLKPKSITFAGQRFEGGVPELARAVGRPREAVRDSLGRGEMARQRLLRALMTTDAMRVNQAMKEATQ